MVFGRVGAIGKGTSGCVSSSSASPYFCMEWNAEDQLIRVTLNSNEVARFTYDPLGRRVEKVTGGVTTSYTYGAEDILREVRGATTLKYVHGPGIDEPLAREDGSGALTYYHADGLGSVVRRTSQAGAVVHEYRYDAWGNSEAGASEPGYSYTAREWDPEISLYYYRARYYDPEAGRFLAEDPLGPEANPRLYLYAGDLPTTRVDPWGLVELNLFAPNSLEWSVANAWAYWPEEYSVAGHGHGLAGPGQQPATYYIDDHRKTPMKPMYSYDLASEISRDSRWHKSVIRLWVCWAAVPMHTGERKAYAKHLAEQLCVPVKAPTGEVQWLPNDPSNPSLPSIHVEGHWKTFTPES